MKYETFREWLKELKNKNTKSLDVVQLINNLEHELDKPYFPHPNSGTINKIINFLEKLDFLNKQEIRRQNKIKYPNDPDVTFILSIMEAKEKKEELAEFIKSYPLINHQTPEELDEYIKSYPPISYQIPNGVPTIVDSEFYKCTTLRSISLHDNLSRIEGLAFGGCTNLETIIIPDSVKSIGVSAFSNCTKLHSVTLPKSLSEIGRGTFGNCKSLETIIIPDSVKSIGESAFSNCTKLHSITLPKSLSHIHSVAFGNCKKLESIIIPDSVTQIDSYAFAQCSQLKKINLPQNIKKIAESTFANCSTLKSIILPPEVEHIENTAFAFCSQLKTITIPVGIKSINKSAFHLCNQLESILIEGNNACKEMERIKELLPKHLQQKVKLKSEITDKDSQSAYSDKEVHPARNNTLVETEEVKEAVYQKIRDVISKLEQGGLCFFSVGMKAKALNIQHALNRALEHDKSAPFKNTDKLLDYKQSEKHMSLREALNIQRLLINKKTTTTLNTVMQAANRPLT